MIQNKAKKVIKKIDVRPSQMVVINDSNELEVLRCNLANLL